MTPARISRCFPASAKNERIISTRIWYDEKRIKERLRLLIDQIAHVNQDCLRHEFENIVDYNRAVGKNAEPLQALFIADFPKHFDKEACEMLAKIISGGPRCGIYTFIAASGQEIESKDFNIDSISGSMNLMKYEEGRLSYTFGEMEHSVLPLQLPQKEEMTEILTTLKNGIKHSDRITIDYDEISDNLTQHPERWFKYDDSDGIDIPIGLEGGGRTIQIHLGGRTSTLHHTLISGTIGSGKSTLLDTIIMSILLRYSPEDVQIYFLDFKRGIESNVYTKNVLPNFRAISLETEPEFGLSVLKYLDQEQAERAMEYHDKGQVNLESFNEKAAADFRDTVKKLPRVVLIIDEFQEMIRDNESEVANECVRLLERVVRQGRALGMHVILASQTLPENLSFIYSQMMNRIALQSTAESAKYILDPDNEAIKSLVDYDPGKGVFNDGGGNRDANHEFRGAMILSEQQDRLLEKIREQQEKCRQEGMFAEMEMIKPRLLLSNIADDPDNPLNRFVRTGELPETLELGCPLYLGDEVSMFNEFSIRLKTRRAQNLLILGEDSKRASQLYGFAAMSILFNAYRLSNGRIPQRPLITFFDFAKTAKYAGLTKKDVINDLCARFPHLIRVFGKDSLMDGIELLTEEYKKADAEGARHYVIFAGLNRAKRLLDSSNKYAIPPKKLFENLIKQGPEKGYNYIIWANEPGSFLSFYGDLLQEFDYRLVYNLKDDEYEQVVMSSSVSISCDNNAISYNPDEDNKKIRVYSPPLSDWFNLFMDRIEGSDAQEVSDSGEYWDDFGEDF
jgi:nucleoside-triphosphatase THEP1